MQVAEGLDDVDIVHGVHSLVHTVPHSQRAARMVRLGTREGRPRTTCVRAGLRRLESAAYNPVIPELCQPLLLKHTFLLFWALLRSDLRRVDTVK